jgi:hypothetical protein
MRDNYSRIKNVRYLVPSKGTEITIWIEGGFKNCHPSKMKGGNLLIIKKCGKFLRFRADSNCCRSFCRALPNRSATEPFKVGQK